MLYLVIVGHQRTRLIDLELINKVDRSWLNCWSGEMDQEIRRTDREIVKHDYAMVNALGFNSNSDNKFDKIVGEINDMTHELQSLSAKKLGAGARPKVKRHLNMGKDDSTGVPFSSGEEMDNLLDEGVWNELKFKHDADCHRADQQAIYAERQVYLIKKKTEMLVNQKKVESLNELYELLNKEMVPRNKTKAKKVKKKVVDWLDKNIKVNKKRGKHKRVHKAPRVSASPSLASIIEQREPSPGQMSKVQEMPNDNTIGVNADGRDAAAIVLGKDKIADGSASGSEQLEGDEVNNSNNSPSEIPDKSASMGRPRRSKKERMDDAPDTEDSSSDSSTSSSSSSSSGSSSKSRTSASSSQSSKSSRFYGIDSDRDNPRKKGKGKKSHSKSKRSGMYDKINSSVKNKVVWAHSGLDYQYRARGLEFNKLSFSQYVAGETKIIAYCDDEDESQGRLRILNKIAYAYDETNNWIACREYYAAVLVAIEMQEEEWNSNFRRFELMLPRKIVTGKNKNKSEVEPKKRVPEVVFCKDFNKGSCVHGGAHYGKYKDENKVWLHHYCAKCLLKNKERRTHSENSDECPLKVL